MNKANFLKMMMQDIETEADYKKDVYSALISNIDEVLPADVDINADNGKTPQDCWKKLSELSRKKQKDGFFSPGPKAFLEFIKDYLNLNITDSSEPQILHSNAKKVISLADLLD